MNVPYPKGSIWVDGDVVLQGEHEADAGSIGLTWAGITKQESDLRAAYKERGEELSKNAQEIMALEGQITALQEQMSRLAEQHAKVLASSVAEAREETREACAMTIDPSDTLFGPEAEQFVILARLVRATPLDSTPLAARIAELEADAKSCSDLDDAAHRLLDEMLGEGTPDDTSMETVVERLPRLKAKFDKQMGDVFENLDLNSLNRSLNETRTALAAEVERHQHTLAQRVAAESALKADLARVSEELGLPPTIGPAPGEIAKRLLKDGEIAINKADYERLIASLPAGPRVVR